MTSESNILVMVNECYGGFTLSESALKEYNKRRPIGSTLVKHSHEIDRNDALMITICNEMGRDVNGSRMSKIQTRSIPKKYSECYKIVDVDGFERIDIDQYKFQVDSIKLIMGNNSISSDDKINLARVVLSSSTSKSTTPSSSDTEEEASTNTII
jgi:hypothetical protein